MPPHEEFIGYLIARLSEDAGPAPLTSMLLRTSCAEGPDLIAHGATDGGMGHERLSELALSATKPAAAGDAARIAAGFDPAWLLQAARLAALRQGAANPTLTLAFLELVRAAHGLDAFDRDSAALYAQLLVTLGRLERLRDTLPGLDIAECHRWSVELDALNPFTGNGDSVEAWLERLAPIFTTGGLEAVSLPWPAYEPFDRLACEAGSSVDDGALVTVVMPVHRPIRTIFTAVNSILAQSWRNLELLIVDDASPREYRSVMSAVADMDERIRILAMPVNRGAYVARNLGLERARGEYVTFQDFDDWSHPRRIEHQVAPLRADRSLLATRSRAIRAFPDLTFTAVGYPPVRINASSLLFRREPVVDLIGRFDTVRKSADMELAARLEAAAPGSALDLSEPAPLAITQLRRGSLSRSDAQPGWLRWDRLAYHDGYERWHAQIRERRASPRLDGSVDARPVPLPDPSWGPSGIGTQNRPRYDVVLVNDWRKGRAESQRHAVDEIRLMLERGLRVALVQTETPFPLPERRQSLSPPVQELINAGAVDLVHLTQAVRAELVMVCDPATMQFPPDIAIGLEANRVAVLVLLPDQGIDFDPDHDSDFRYRVADCAANAERLFSRPALWVPRDARARAFLAESRVAELADFDFPAGFDPLRLALPAHRPSPNPDRPVLGRHAPDHWSHWPARRSELLLAYPDDDRFDVRIRGGHRTPTKVLGQDMLPPNWVSFASDQLAAREFLAQLDFFVYFHHPRARVTASIGALEAMASGCVAILPPHFEPTYGEAAVYCEPQRAQDVIMGLYRSPASYADQQRRGRAHVRDEHDPRTFHDRLARLLSR